jgi:hypothetical protein
MVEVFCEEPVEFTDGAILMAGKFEVLNDDPSGMYYRMRDAELVERYDNIRWTGQLANCWSTICLAWGGHGVGVRVTSGAP